MQTIKIDDDYYAIESGKHDFDPLSIQYRKLVNDRLKTERIKIKDAFEKESITIKEPKTENDFNAVKKKTDFFLENFIIKIIFYANLKTIINKYF